MSASPILRDAVEGRATLLPWTVEQYHWAIRTGFLPEDTTFELIDGWIVRKDRSEAGEDPMTIGDRHRLAVHRLARLMPQFESHACFLQSQQPIALPPRNEPEPDAAIVRGEVDSYTDGAPGAADVLCAVEVADGSLRRDRDAKFKAYAAGGIPCYVIVNLVEDVIEVYTTPRADAYADRAILKPDDVLRLPTAGAATVDVPARHLLP